MAEQPLISAEEVASVLGTGDAQPEAGDDAALDTGFSLRRPIGIAPGDEARARERLLEYCGWLTRAVGRELDSVIEIELKGFQQRQVRVALESMSAPLWLLTFAADGGGGLVLVLEAPCALALVELAMGGVGNFRAEPRDPTPLERRVMGGLSDALCKRLNEKARVKFQGAEFRIGAVPARLAAPGETVGAGLLSLKVAGIEHRGFLLGTASLLREAEVENPSSGRIGPLARRLVRVPVEARPVLRAGRVSLCDLMALRPGNVLRLEPAEDALLELRVGGESPLFGRISRRGAEPVFVTEKIRGLAVSTRKENKK